MLIIMLDWLKEGTYFNYYAGLTGFVVFDYWNNDSVHMSLLHIFFESDSDK